MASRPPEEPEQQARQRWMVIQMVRAMGVGLVILGILLARDKVDLAGDTAVNHWIGYGFIAVGLVDGFLMPIVLARKWSSRAR